MYTHPTPHGPRWLDLVYRFGRVALSLNCRITAWLKIGNKQIRFNPCLPKDWKEFKVHYRYYETVYHITVGQSEEPPSVIVDGACMLDAAITMNDDRREHFVEVKIPVVKD